MKNLSNVYDVVENKRGKAAQGFVRPTICEFFTSSTCGFEEIIGTPVGTYIDKIVAPDAAAYDFFGYSVAIDGTKIVVGAYQDDDNGDSSGSAYIFNTDGTYVTKIVAPDGAADDWFGYSVAIDGTKIVVGAHQDNDNGSGSGSAYIFNTDGTYVTKIVAPDGVANDQFGYSVAIDGTKIVVGAYHDDVNDIDSGSAYIFNTDGSYVTKIVAPDAVSSDQFGNSVAISDTKIVVGVRYDDDNGYSSGSAYIFNTDGTYVTKIVAPDGAADDWFGHSVAIDGTKIVVGAHQDNDNGSGSGSAYIFNTDGTYVTKIVAPDAADGDWFGISVAIDGTKLVVGAYGDGSNLGSAHIFNTDGSYVTKIVAPDAANADYFGYSVAIDGTKIVVGAHGNDDNGDMSGSAYIYSA